MCLTGNCIRAYIIHADDKNYRWKMTRVGVAEAAGDQRIVSSEVLRAETALYMLSATLENYFDHPFGSATQLDE